jgi:hypothetical protein
MLEKAHEVVSFLEKPHVFNAMNDMTAACGGDGEDASSVSNASGAPAPHVAAQIVRVCMSHV